MAVCTRVSSMLKILAAELFCEASDSVFHLCMRRHQLLLKVCLTLAMNTTVKQLESDWK